MTKEMELVVEALREQARQEAEKGDRFSGVESLELMAIRFEQRGVMNIDEEKQDLRQAIVRACDEGVVESIVQEMIDFDPTYNWDLEMVTVLFQDAAEKWRKPHAEHPADVDPTSDE